MPEIIRIFTDPIPAMRFIGKPYSDYSHWGEWFANGWFDILESAMGGTDAILRIWVNGAGYVGMERHKEGEDFTYWIGMFTPAGTPVPEGFDYVDFPAGVLGTCWIYGKESEVHSLVGECPRKLKEAGIAVATDEQGALWHFENCLCPRFTTPDEKGNVILDYCYFVKL